MFGLIGSKANQIEPHKRMLSSMTPTIIKKGKKPLFALGSPGGGTIITTVFQVVLNLIEYKMDLEQAVNKSRFHHQWTPDILFLEQNQNDESIVNKLNKIGYKIERPNFLGCVGAVQIREDGSLLGVGDKRGDDCAAGF
jgi:gamma-glutamyltranspeptidase/glutathione hydrolase